jgi:DNA topoisomerase I
MVYFVLILNNPKYDYMADNLVIVESPAKAKTIERFLGSEYIVKSSMGHIRDLAKKNFGIDVNNGFAPQYIIPDEKKKFVEDLKKASKKAKTIWLASDEDREGEAIAWHLAEVLELPLDKTKRIVFHEITREAILKAIQNPRTIDQKLVDSQQARRILDRLVGFELSPVLWKKVKPGLSAGRVQSVAVRLIVEREREIAAFNSSSSYKVTAVFHVKDKQGNVHELNAEIPEKFANREKALQFLTKCLQAGYEVIDIVTKPAKKSPSPPFTTSTLQQEASRKLGFSVAQTMSVAQRLYEAGKITYMRTDSVNLSDTALGTAKKVIASMYGKEYHFPRRYKTKSKGAQEAHEAIRPTYLDQEDIPGTVPEKKLYSLIWKRTIASQMSDAQLEKTTVTISISTDERNFIASGEVLKFDGFLKLYKESSDEDLEENGSGLLPPLALRDILDARIIQATERFTNHPARYTEASLVRKLEELGIGRPSTYAPTISTIQQREYVIKEDRPGKERKYTQLLLSNGKIHEETKAETTGAEKSKLFPTDVGMVVTDFLIVHFPDIMNYQFTASVEKEFDEIAEGNLNWTSMLEKFYEPFSDKVKETTEKSEKSTGSRLLGNEPGTGKPVYVKIGRYGPMAQIGESDADEKPRFASLPKDKRIESISLEEAMTLFSLPRSIGLYEDKEVVAALGRFGPFLRHNNQFFSLKKDVDDPLTVTLERAIELIEEKRKREREKLIKTYTEDPELQVLNGRWGPYISYKGKNYKVPREKNPGELSHQDCLHIIQEQEKKPAGKKPPRRKK